jgi:hypothetical protein
MSLCLNDEFVESNCCTFNVIEEPDQCSFTGTVSWLPIAIELTGVMKQGGTVTKHISLTPEGKLASHGEDCWIATGTMRRARYDNWRAFAADLENMPPNGAIVLGTLSQDRPEEAVYLVMADNPCAKQPGRAARTKEYLSYRPVPTLALLDHDAKHFSEDIKTRVKELGGFVKALESICPELATAGTILRASTSAGISNTETGEQYPGSGGAHLYILVADGTDIERFLKTLHDLCWLYGLAGYWINKRGSFLEYSIVDTAVAGAERLVFEADPKVDPPLVQAKRLTTVKDGTALDTKIVHLTEQDKLAKLKAAAKKKLKPEADAARESFIAENARKAEERGMDPIAAREMAEQFAKNSILYPGATIDFVDANLVVVDVAEILADPERFDKKACWDPVEGRPYGHHTAKFYADNMLIYSHAHGGCKFKLRSNKTERQNEKRKSIDNSRASRAWKEIVRYKKEGCDYTETRERLLASDDQGVVDWVNDRGLPNDERELHFAFDKIKVGSCGSN